MVYRLYESGYGFGWQNREEKTTSSYIVLVGAALSLMGWSAYIRNTLRGSTKPNRVTYFMWSVAPLIATAAALANGVRWAAVPVFMSGFCPLLVFVSSFVSRQGHWALNRRDYVCGVFSMMALVLWLVTRQPNIAIVFAIATDALAALPTVVKARSHPGTETGVAYLLAFASAATSFAALRRWTFAEWAFPLYLLVVNATIYVVVLRGTARAARAGSAEHRAG
jgi:hypothetical protein